MPEKKKETKVKVSKPKVAKAKPASVAKPKAKVIKTPAVRLAPKSPEAKAPVVEKKAKKTRSYNRKPTGTFADLLKKQAELEEIKKGAKADLKKQFDAHIKEADRVKAQYKELFQENIESAPKVRGAGAKKARGRIPGLKPFSLAEVEEFVEQKKQGKAIKIVGRRPKSIARMEDAYRHSEDAKEILKTLNQ